MYVVMNSGAIVFESSKAAMIIKHLEKTGSPAGSLILQIWTPDEFRKIHDSPGNRTHHNSGPRTNPSSAKS